MPDGFVRRRAWAIGLASGVEYCSTIGRLTDTLSEVLCPAATSRQVVSKSERVILA
jgi:hypothetical protein